MTQFASDGFTGTATTELNAYSSNWVQASYSGGPAQISSGNRARVNGVASGQYYHTAAPGTADYSVSADAFAASASGTHRVGIQGRMLTSVQTLYRARLVSTTGFELYKVVNGTATQLGSSVAQSLTANFAYNIKLRMSGSTIELYKLGEGTASISVTDSSVTAAGQAGLYFASATTVNDTSGLHLDNFSADTLTGGSPGNASGDTVTETSSIIAGAATGAAAAAGQTLALTTSITGGAATGAAQAPSTTVSASGSLLAGMATGAADASGQTITGTFDLILGRASAGGSGTAPGATLQLDASLQPGVASGDAEAPAALVSTALNLVPAVATGDALAIGQLLTSTADFIPGGVIAGGTGTAAGATVQDTSTLLPGAASGAAAASDIIVFQTASIVPGTADGEAAATGFSAELSEIFQPGRAVGEAVGLGASFLETMGFLPGATGIPLRAPALRVFVTTKAPRVFVSTERARVFAETKDRRVFVG